jgi:hypothetical protein
MKKTIFISSTYKDLQQHRNVVWGALQELDVEVKGMEDFGARKSTPLETCLKEVKESHVYVGIISMCYGSIDEQSGKSYTQIEYEYAKELGLDIFIYLIDENVGSVKTGDIDFGDNQLLLKRFKNLLKKNHTVDFFTNENDLGQKLFKKLDSLTKKPKQLAARPDSVYSKVYRIKLNEEDWVVFIGYVDGKPYEIFTGLADSNEGILLPNDISEGNIVKDDTQGYARYDFTFINKRGFKTTIEGIIHRFEFQISSYDKAISNLLRNGIELSVIVDTIKHLKISDDKYKDWNYQIINLLTNNIT